MMLLEDSTTLFRFRSARQNQGRLSRWQETATSQPSSPRPKISPTFFIQRLDGSPVKV
jgi:hypothetical protein